MVKRWGLVSCSIATFFLIFIGSSLTVDLFSQHPSVELLVAASTVHSVAAPLQSPKSQANQKNASVRRLVSPTLVMFLCLFSMFVMSLN